MSCLALPLMLLGLAFVAEAQLTPQQKLDDFRAIAGLYNRQYAPYELKIELFRFDMLDLRPWLRRIEASKTDLEYYGILREYVASLQDGHAAYLIPSNFSATLPFHTDLYDGRPLIDQINRARLPAAEFPFEIGDELISVDGQTVAQWEARLRPYFASGNARTTRRAVLGRITSLSQQEVPWAPEAADTATVVIRREGGAGQTFTMPRIKSGFPLVSVARLPDPHQAAADTLRTNEARDVLSELANVTVPSEQAVLGIGSLAPVFRPPDGFTLRSGGRPADLFYTGTFPAEGLRIGYLRIPRFSLPPGVNEDVELARFITEMAFLQQSTDGLIVDVMHNPGGRVDIVEGLASTLIPGTFRTVGFEVRATWLMVQRFEAALQLARLTGAPQYVIDRLTSLLAQVRSAFAENRGRTGPLPLVSSTLDLAPLTLPDGSVFAYTKPVMVLIDEVSFSGADMFPAVLRDNNRGILFGYRTAGAGGSVSTLPAGAYSEGLASVTQTLMSRPDGRYIENFGVEPDIVNDYMTRDNLVTQGRPYVEAFTRAMVDHIRASRQ